MKKIKFIQADVFSDSPFGGNPVAVIPDAEDVPEEEMQLIAKEISLSEVAFVQPPTDPKADFRVRCFTPTTEVPFSGHTMLGTFYVLAEEGMIDLKEPVTQVYGESAVGALPLDLHVTEGKVRRVVMVERDPEFQQVAENPAILAAALDVDLTDLILRDELPPEVVSTGLPALLVPVRSLKVLRKVVPQTPRLRDCCRQLEAKALLVFTFETLDPFSTVHVRLFAPVLGVTEDPATGSANGALGAYLVKHEGIKVDPVTKIVAEQGYEMGRPSTVFVEVDTMVEPMRVRVGGSVVRAMEGYIYF